MKPRILVVDDDKAIRETVSLALENSGYAVARARNLAEARAAVREAPVALVITDIYMPGGDGLELLRELSQIVPAPPVILMTARGSVETAALAAKTGAFDYIAKPFDLSALLGRVRAALKAHPIGEPFSQQVGPESLIVGSHPAIVEVYKAVGRVAPLRIPVLVLGETGTGKELVARALHRFGAQPGGPFVAVHCGAIPDALLESELFGHRRGAFTDAHRDRIGALAQADGGTVFLDEIGEISPVFQVKLLRFLEDGVVTPLGAEQGERKDVRVVAATHRDLRRMVSDGRFRQDLYFRLAGYEIPIPPLPDRLSDLPLLVEHFQRQAEGDLGKPAGPIAVREVLEAFEAYPWPGNVRELAHVVRRLLIDAGTVNDVGVLTKLLSTPVIAEGPDGPPSGASERPGTGTSLEDVERQHILAVLEAAGGNKTMAARILGIERKTLTRKLRRGEPTTDEADEEEP